MKRDVSLIALGAASCSVYVIVAALAGESGFPLDDAWIHQTYARNLGWHGQWAFILGQPSAGSTAPLWTFLLAVGYFLRIDYLVWTTMLNAILLGALAWLASKLANQWWVGALVAVEWHLAWAAASGMETVLFCVLVLGAWWIALERRFHLGWSGVLAGLSVWARPDGLTLLPFIAGLAWMAEGNRRQQIVCLGWLGGGAAVILIPYFLFNFALSGQLWPNTFFAKQAEYAILRQLPLWERLVSIFSTPLIGALALLLPGLILVRERGRLLMLGWTAAFLSAYAVRLPVTYQHGRYLIPAIPVLVIVGGAGMWEWVQWKAEQMWRRVASRAWVLAVGGVAAAFWFLGAQALTADNRFINSEMVKVAEWAAAGLPEGALIAAHDIGALGYFADVQLIDLAGLVSPEVIPLLGDDERLWDFVRESGAEYVITFPGWCPAFSQNLSPIFQTGPLCSEENKHMTVYRIE